MDFLPQYSLLKSLSTEYFKCVCMWGVWSKEEATGGVIPARSCIPKREETQPDGSEADLNILAQIIFGSLEHPFSAPSDPVPRLSQVKNTSKPASPIPETFWF